MPGRNLDEPRGIAAAIVPRGVALGSTTLELDRLVVRRDGEEIRLRPRSADVLGHLVAHAGRVVPKQELIDAVWKGTAVTDDSLVQCLVEIRRALGPEQTRVRTVRGRGYVLDTEPAATADPAAGDVLSLPASLPVQTDAGLRGARRWTVAGVALVTLLAVAGALLAMRRGPAEARVSPQETMNTEARHAYEEGRDLMARSRSQVDLQRARQLLERATRLDDGYAAAHAALANTLVLLSAFGVERPAGILPAASAAAQRAVSLDPTLGSAWQALAHAQTQWDWDWAAAERSYRRAVALDPSSRFNMIFAHLLAGTGRLDEAVAESDRWLAQEPDAAHRLASNCFVRYLARRHAEAIGRCDRAVAADPAFAVAHLWQALVRSALGDHEGAMASALASRPAMATAPTWVVGYVHARAGRLDEAREVLRALEARAATAYVAPLEPALVAAALGDRASALDWLERGQRERGRWMELLAVLPAADPLRGEPRFRALLQALRLPELS